MEGAIFPVVFYDGEKELSMGNVVVRPSSMSVKRFQALVGEKIGLSGGQVSVYLADRKGSRVPLTNRVNVSAFCREEGAWYFLAVLNRSTAQGSGGRRRRKGFDGLDHVTLLRRDGNTALSEQVVAREKYLMSLGLGVGFEGRNDITGERGSENCEECLKAGEEFHRCVNDAVTFRFRSLAGPIARPRK